MFSSRALLSPTAGGKGLELGIAPLWGRQMGKGHTLGTWSHVLREVTWKRTNSCQLAAFGYKSWHLIGVVVAVGTQTPEGGRRANRRNGLFGFWTIHDEIHSDMRLSRGREDLNVWENKLLIKNLIQIQNFSQALVNSLHEISMAKSRSHLSVWFYSAGVQNA